jgi:hypothetical protein
MLSLSLCLLVVKEGHLTCVVPNESKRNDDNDQKKCSKKQFPDIGRFLSTEI